jgi:hypothetical protein
MKDFIKKNTAFLVLLSVTAILFLSLFVPIHLPGNPLDYRTAGTDIIFKYEIFGCGSLIRKIKKGGPSIYEKANLPVPDSGVYEIQLTPDSDEPMNHIGSGEFYTEGIAEKYSYYMKIEVVGIERGAPECCIPDPAYNEVVPLVKVVKWEPVTFTPQLYFTLRHDATILILVFLLIADTITLICEVYFWVKKRMHTHIKSRPAKPESLKQ